MLLLTLILCAQMPATGPVPDYAMPVREFAPVEIPEGPILGCIHRPASVPYDKLTLDSAAVRLQQLIQYSELNPSMVIEPVRWRTNVQGDDLITREKVVDARQGGGFLDQEIQRLWKLFAARAYEIRMFVHQPEEAQVAARRTIEAWRALQSLIAQRGVSLRPGQTLAMTDIDALIAIIESQL